MHILVLASDLPVRPLSGATTAIYHFTREWTRRHRVTLVIPVFAPIEARLIDACAQELGARIEPVFVHPSSRARTIRSALAQLIQGRPPIRYHAEITEYLRELAQRDPFNVLEIEGTGFGGGLYFNALDGLAQRPRAVLTFYDVLWNWWKREFLAKPNLISLIRWLNYRLWEPRFVRAAHCCVFLSDTDADLVASVITPRQTLTVPFGCSLDDFDHTPVPDTRHILFVGSFLHPPNRVAAEWLIREIWPGVRRTVPDAHLAVIGFHPPAELLALAEQSGVELIGNAPELRPYYARARAVVVPIRTGSGIRVKILEAWAAGRPVVATHIGAEGLPVAPGVNALVADDTAGLVEALTRVLIDKPLAEYLAANGRELAKREFSWEALARRKEAAFQALPSRASLER